MSLHHPLRIGTRGSPLALAQARMVAEALGAVEPSLTIADAVEIVVIKTTGDHVLDRPLAEIGGKGLFTKEIEDGLLDHSIDLAVHSMKDVPTFLPDGLVIAAMLPRADPRDALIAPGLGSLAEIPMGATVGTASLRRAAQLLAVRPDLKVTSLRGNVQTRLRKVNAGEVSATFLAKAGLDRLGLVDVPATPIDPKEMLPAVAQGAVGIECRQDNAAVMSLLQRIDHAETHCRVLAERALLTALDGSCRTPIAALAVLKGDDLLLDGLAARPDGTEIQRTERRGSKSSAVQMGRDAGEELRARLGPDFFTA
ncbi:MAG: hydroxymethylbilane synthase [Geminicoccaceae bacterium]